MSEPEYCEFCSCRLFGNEKDMCSSCEQIFLDLADRKLKSKPAAAEEKNALYERLLAKAEWIQFDNGKSISQPCDQPEGSQCWHDQDENLYDTALLAFAALRGE